MKASGQINFKQPAQNEKKSFTNVSDQAVSEDTSQMYSEKEEEKLKELVVKTQNPILRIQTAIPFEPTPDEISVDINKVNIVFRQIFGANESYSFPTEEIAAVSVDTTPFFASLHFTFRSSSNKAISVKFLKKREAILMRRLVDGLRLAKDNKIDLSKLDNETIIGQTTELGKIEETEY